MSVMTLRLPESQHERLRVLAAHRGVSLNKLFEELASCALAEFDLETRFQARALRGDPAAGLALLDRMETGGGA